MHKDIPIKQLRQSNDMTKLSVVLNTVQDNQQLIFKQDFKIKTVTNKDGQLIRPINWVLESSRA
jgi:hypothetical protein